MKNEIDMLHGPLFMKIIMFTLPLAASSILQQLFNSVDVAVVGRFASSQALAAVGVLVARPILTLMDTPPDVLDMAVTYLRIFFLGIPFFMIFDFGSAILRSMGDTRRPLYILVAAGIVNTVLNLVFVIIFHMGVAGVAFGKTRMHIALAFQWIAAFYEISGSVMRGMGKSMEPTLITIFGTCLLRIAWIYAIMPGWRGFDHLVMVYPVSWTITAILMLALFFWRSRMLLRDSTKPA